MENFVVKDGKLTINEGIDTFSFNFRSNIRLAKRRKVKTIEFPSTLQELNTRITREIFPNLEAVDLSKCSNLKEISKQCFSPEGTDGEAFQNRLQINFPEGLETLGESAFENAFLKRVTIKSKSINVKSSCFNSCKVNRVYLEATDNKITLDTKSFAYSRCELLWVKAPKIILYSSCLKYSSLKFVIFDGKLEVLPEYTFYDCDELELLALPSTLRKIGKRVFKNCKSLKIVTLPDSIESINETAFEETNQYLKIWYLGRSWSVKEFVNLLEERNDLLKQGDTRTLKEFFESNSDLGVIVEHKYRIENNRLVIKEGVTSFESIFTKNFDFSIDSIDSLVVPETLRELNAEFKVLRNLKHIIIPKNSRLEVIGAHCFECCGRIEEFDFPKTLRAIGDNAFMGTKLKKIELTVNNLELGKFCFSYCKELQSVILKGSELLLDCDCFLRCENLREVVLNCTVNAKEYPIFRFASTFTISKNTIPKYLFKYCHSLKHLKLPDTVEIIETGTFRECEALESIELPESTRLLGDEVFNDCKNLRYLKLPQKLEKISDVEFLQGTSDELIVEYDGITWSKHEFASLVNSYTELAINSGKYDIKGRVEEHIFDIKKFDKCVELKFNQYARLQYPEEFAVKDGVIATDCEETSLF